MEPEEFEEVKALLNQELQEFYGWVMEELGGGYFIEHPELSPAVWEQEVSGRIRKRLQTDRALFWERDRYAFFDDPKRPSVYRLMEAEDLELIHYRDDFYCEHFKVDGEAPSPNDQGPDDAGSRRYDESFGILMVSQKSGWMYRLDFCQVCGLIEIWSMRYDPKEIALYGEDG
ncbi:MAG: hypothetical protein AB1640_22245 [bacterium]